MSSEILWERDLDKEFKKWKKSPEWKENKEDIDKTSLEFLNKTGEKVYENALKVSPESKKWLEWAKDEFKRNNEQIENQFKSWNINEKERQEKLDNSVKQYTWKITEIVWTMEWSQSMQSKKFSEEQDKQQKTYIEQLEDFLKKIKEKLAQDQEKNLKDWLNKWAEAHKKWNEEAEKSQAEAEKKLTEALWEWGKK